MAKGKRSFRVVTMDGKKLKKCGRYLANRAVNAASKAFTQWCRDKNCSGLDHKVSVVVRETTQGSKHKEYKYYATQKKNKEIIDHKGVSIQHAYTNKLVSQK